MLITLMITQVRIQDAEVEEENAPFATPPITPASTLEYSIIQSLQPTGEPSSSNFSQPEDADLQSFYG